jgi:iron complex transport system ATP-binding protein
MATTPLPLELVGVGVVRDGSTLLHDVDWTVDHGERWIVLGANGSGKTTLLRIASIYLHPSRGTVRVLGGELGKVDIRTLRPRIGLASPAFGALLRAELTPVEVVMTARNAALEPWWHTYDDDDRDRARALLDRFHVLHAAERPVATLSSGERQRVLLARAFSGQPGLVLLDEPTAGLDLAGREEQVAALGSAAGAVAGPPTVLVTHLVEEIPTGSTHVLLVRSGRVVGRGPIDDVLTAEALSDTFGLSLELERRGARWTAFGRS